MAQSVLGVPGAATASEREWSTSGDTVTNRRESLKTGSVNFLCFCIEICKISQLIFVNDLFSKIAKKIVSKSNLENEKSNQIEFKSENRTAFVDNFHLGRCSSNTRVEKIFSRAEKIESFPVKSGLTFLNSDR